MQHVHEGHGARPPNAKAICNRNVPRRDPSTLLLVPAHTSLVSFFKGGCQTGLFVDTLLHCPISCIMDVSSPFPMAWQSLCKSRRHTGPAVWPYQPRGATTILRSQKFYHYQNLSTKLSILYTPRGTPKMLSISICKFGNQGIWTHSTPFHVSKLGGLLGWGGVASPSPNEIAASRAAPVSLPTLLSKMNGTIVWERTRLLERAVWLSMA